MTPKRVFRRVLLVVVAMVIASGGVLVVVGSGADTRGARVLRFTITSRFVHRAPPVAAVVPHGLTGRPRPLLVFLHGKGEDQNSNLDDAMIAALARLGPRAPDVIFPYGGPDSYWHDRADGAWGSYVLREVIGQRSGACTPTRGAWRSGASRWGPSARSTWPAWTRTASAP